MTEHYFTEKPTSPFRTKKISATILHSPLTFLTASGVFSFGRVDPGSLLLIENAIVNTGWTVLDLGCGWGLVGITIKRAFPSVLVTMTEINQRALQIAKQNAISNRVKVKFLHGNLYEPVKDNRFDTILINPPMKAGREICYKMIEQSIHHLAANGLLQLVALHNRGGKMLEKKMKEILGNVRTTAKQGGFRVYVSSKVPRSPSS